MRPHACDGPVAIEASGGRPEVTEVGTESLYKLPGPLFSVWPQQSGSSPERPHRKNSAPLNALYVWFPVTAIGASSTPTEVPFPRTPPVSAPQQYALPPCVRRHVDSSPAAIPDGPSCPIVGPDGPVLVEHAIVHATARPTQIRGTTRMCAKVHCRTSRRLGLTREKPPACRCTDQRCGHVARKCRGAQLPYEEDHREEVHGHSSVE